MDSIIAGNINHERPTNRSQCAGATRPCPYVGCKYHLYLDVNPETGSIKYNHPELEPWELPMTCALDIADMGGVVLDDVGYALNITRERARQVEGRGLRKLTENGESLWEFYKE